MSDQTTTQVHATCVVVDGVGLLLRGPSGSGKSDLAIRLIDTGARLVADDRVDLSRRGDDLWASPPPALAGLIEVRGLGILRLDALAEAAVGLIIDLVPETKPERMPEPRTWSVLGLERPLIDLDPFENSAPAKVRLAAKWVNGHIMPGP